MNYVKELREYWRSWIGAALGLSVGTGAQAYTNGLFAPHLIAEFGWDRAIYALQGTMAVFMFLVLPLVGRLTDLFGVRKIAAFGVIALPASYVAFSLQSGSLAVFFGLSILKMIVGATTASLVYCRVVALKFTETRGLALAICASAPALMMAACAPLIGQVIEQYGWRVGYQAMAGLSLALGLLAVAIIPPQQKMNKPVGREGTDAPSDRQTRRDYAIIFRTRAFWIVLVGMFLCNSPNVLAASQFGLMLVEQGIALDDVPWMISIYGTSVVVGRFACGLALDHFPSHATAAVSMMMPAVGLFILGAGSGLAWMIIAAIVFLGLAQGAEGDLVAYIVAQYFPRELYGSVAGLVGAGLALSSAVGALALSFILHRTDSFSLFIYLTGGATVIGASLFGLLRGVTRTVAFKASKA